MFTFDKSKLILNFTKNIDDLKLITECLTANFSTFKTTPLELAEDKFIVSSVIYKDVVVYAGINKMQELADKSVVCNFSYSYLHPWFRGHGIGKQFFYERMKYCWSVYPSTNFTTTIRNSNDISLHIAKSNYFIPVCNYTYKDGELGIKLIKINN